MTRTYRTPAALALAIQANTDAYLRGDVTRAEWSAEQRRLWDTVPESHRYDVCRILVPYSPR